jgi:tetratricopeptide (TPR) repeat protein
MYLFLDKNTKVNTNPGLEELQPLYQAVLHGCAAGQAKDALHKVYIERILRGIVQYSSNSLGAFASNLAAMTHFFTEPWQTFLPEIEPDDRAWLLSEVAFHLMVLGRIGDARGLAEEAMRLHERQNRPRLAADSATNLSYMNLCLGDIQAARVAAEYALKRVGDHKAPPFYRATYANVLAIAGRVVEARREFEEAEAKQAGWDRDNPLLYSQSGFMYCELLMLELERLAWHWQLHAGGRSNSPGDTVVIQGVKHRAKKMELAARSANLAGDQALANLTLARVELFCGIQLGGNCGAADEAVEAGVSGMRRAGQIADLPLVLLTRAWLRCRGGKLVGAESAQADLDEAWQIAVRGPMPLLMTDIHLYRARLFNQVTPYPWTSPADDLAQARHLIEKHGYYRRLAELEDAEALILK